MSHAAALTDAALRLLPDGYSSKRLSMLVACSYRTIQDWRAHRRRMCLDHAVELAARNEAFAAALLARIADARRANEVALRTAADPARGGAAGLVGTAGWAGPADQRGRTADAAAAVEGSAEHGVHPAPGPDTEHGGHHA